jgi:hypothetical protein
VRGDMFLHSLRDWDYLLFPVVVNAAHQLHHRRYCKYLRFQQGIRTLNARALHCRDAENRWAR